MKRKPWLVGVCAGGSARCSVHQRPPTGQIVASRRLDGPGPRSAAQWKERRFHGQWHQFQYFSSMSHARTSNCIRSDR